VIVFQRNIYKDGLTFLSMKKKVVFGALILSIFLIMSASFFVLAQEEGEEEEGLSAEQIEKENVDKAYTCLEDSVKGKCPSLNVEERIFSLFAIGECKGEVKASSRADECWPENGCEIKTTAQAILALDKVGENTDLAQEWLFLKIISAKQDLEWYLEIDSSEETICDITYRNKSNTITIREDKTISSSISPCLTLSDGNWWLRIAPNCLEEEYQISCDKAFLTTLLFKRKNSDTIHVSEKAQSEAAEGILTEKVESFCFSKDGNTCDYEGSLWATFAMQQLGEEINSYLPYLVTVADRYDDFLPESFLYSLTGYTDFRASLMSKQLPSKYWDKSGDKFYDTAVALYPFSLETFQEKTDAKGWLFDNQDNSGCFGGIRNTAFLLHSLWPRVIIDEPDDLGCGESGYFCMSLMDCDGNILDGYDCPGLNMCCDAESIPETCLEQAGEVCNSEQSCIGGTEVESSDSQFGETCCVEGRCEVPVIIDEISECEENFGICSLSCNEETQIEDIYECSFS